MDIEINLKKVFIQLCNNPSENLIEELSDILDKAPMSLREKNKGIFLTVFSNWYIMKKISIELLLWLVLLNHDIYVDIEEEINEYKRNIQVQTDLLYSSKAIQLTYDRIKILRELQRRTEEVYAGYLDPHIIPDLVPEITKYLFRKSKTRKRSRQYYPVRIQVNCI